MQALGLGLTDTGKVREQNEDALLVDNEIGLYIVCDGMGGHARGEVAAEMSVKTAARSVEDQRALLERARKGLEPETVLVDVVRGAVEEACREVYRTASTRVGFAGMGTTLTMLLFVGEKAVMGHVGDTRLYLQRSGELHLLSTDHTMVEAMVQSGSMTRDEARKTQFANVVTRAIGTQEAVQVDTLLMDVLPGDRYLLCSDGLTEHVGEEPLAKHVAGDFEGIPDELVALANAQGGTDNITAVVVRVEAEEAAAAASVEVSGADVQLDVLGSLFLFEDLTLAQLQRILNVCELRSYGKGEKILQEGEPGRRLYVIAEGRVSLVRKDKLLCQLAVGDCAGETFLLQERPARATMTAVEPTRLLEIEAARFHEMTRRRPWMGVDLLSRLGERTSATLERVHRLLGAQPQDLRPGDFL